MENTALMPLHQEPPTPEKSSFGQLGQISPGVFCLPFALVNVYLVGEPGPGRPWTLVDTGLPTAADTIVQAAEERFGSGNPPQAIVLTHGHFDHVGSVRQLAERWNVQVYAHELELPYLTGRSDYPPADPTVGGGTMATVGSRTFPRHGINLGSRIHALPEDGSVPGLSDWRWIHTPGHAPGHVSLFRDRDRVLLAGDAFVTVRQESVTAVLSRKQEVWRPPAYFTIDWQAARRSVETLARLDPLVAGTGHGVPMAGERLHRELRELADHFDRYIPAQGRYVKQPAVADTSGVVSVPPPVRDPLPLMMAGLGATALLGALVSRGRKKR
jgi:glyoxylase-like metal-dependent hydrolase (beta-lactamase superfamily II)